MNWPPCTWGQRLWLAILLSLTAPGSASGQTPEPGPLRFTLGVADGATNEIFGEVSGVKVDPAGRIYELDRQESRIRVFGPDGGFLTEGTRQTLNSGAFTKPGNGWFGRTGCC